MAKKKVSKKKMTKKKASTKGASAPNRKPAKSAKTSKPKKMAIKKAAVVMGEVVPGWSAPATGNQIISSDSLRGKNVVLYFYPKDKTPGCTIEGQDFTRLHKAFSAANTEVFGISRDTIKLHESFKECENYSIDLLSDEDEKLCSLFGVIKMKNMYGKQVRGIERSTFVIDSTGRLVKEWRGVKVPGHAEEVLDYVKGL